jgi:hypothetical protein
MLRIRSAERSEPTCGTKIARMIAIQIPDLIIRPRTVSPRYLGNSKARSLGR